MGGVLSCSENCSKHNLLLVSRSIDSVVVFTVGNLGLGYRDLPPACTWHTSVWTSCDPYPSGLKSTGGPNCFGCNRFGPVNLFFSTTRKATTRLQDGPLRQTYPSEQPQPTGNVPVNVHGLLGTLTVALVLGPGGSIDIATWAASSSVVYRGCTPNSTV